MTTKVRFGAATSLLAVSLFSTATTSDNPGEACFRTRTNAERAKVGVVLLTDSPQLDAVASRHSDQMADSGTIYHNNNLPHEIPPFEYAGENVGEGPDCDSIHAAFMNSPHHRENILDPDFRQLGLGVTVKGGVLYVTEIFFTPRVVKAPPPPKPKPKPTPKASSSCS